MHNMKRIFALFITFACFIFLPQCERNSLYFFSPDKLSFLGLENLFASSQINIQAGNLDFANSGTYNFGTVFVGGSSPAVVFTLRNTGADTLTLTGAPAVAVSGDNAADFTATVPAVTILSPGVSTTFTVTFTPGLAGTRNAVISILYNVNGKESTHRINLTGTGSAAAVPDINLNVGGSDYFSGSSYDFGSVAAGSSSATINFTIQNVGDATLTLTGAPAVAVGGVNPTAFNVSVPAATGIASGAFEIFSATFMPAAAGPFSAVITIPSDDPDIESPYTITITGTGTPAPVPDINVRVAGVDYLDGSTYDFGEKLIGSAVYIMTFTIQNLGTANLNIGTVTYGGTYPGELTGTGAATTPVTAGSSTTFTLGFEPKAEGLRDAYVLIATNDPDEPAYTINLLRTGVMPVMVVHGGGNNTTSIYDPVTNSFTAGSTLSGVVAEGGHSFDDPDDGTRVVIHGGAPGLETQNTSRYDPLTGTFSAGPLTSSPVGIGAHSFLTISGYVMLIVGGQFGSVAANTYTGGSFGIFWESLDWTTGGGSLALPMTTGDMFILEGNSGFHGTIYNQVGVAFDTTSVVIPGAFVRNGAHAFAITGGMLLVPVGGTNGDEVYFYNPSVPSFTVYSQVLSDYTTGAGGHNIPITSGANAGRVLIVHGGPMGSLATSVYNTDGTITPGPSFTDGPVGVGAFSFAITGGPYRGMYMIVHGNGGDVATIFDPDTLTFVGTVYLPSYAGAGAHCFPAQ